LIADDVTAHLAIVTADRLVVVSLTITMTFARRIARSHPRTTISRDVRKIDFVFVALK
jgi:hypothetical protein